MPDFDNPDETSEGQLDPSQPIDNSSDDAGPAGGGPEDEVTEGGELNHTEEPTPLVPESVDAPAVEVSPNPTPTNVKTEKVHGKNYEVTPEAGYRRV